ncbi:MAG: TRAM domain-containing protein, partial [Ruminococcus sp.]|nr:TRAM domain-containing protein [Ruminococcus sp.]
MPEKNQFFDTVIEDVTSEGSGVCHLDGFAVFVPDTAIGDKVRVKLVKVLKNYAYGI